MLHTSRMVCLRFLWLCSFLAIIWSKQAAAQDSFGDILLQAFTTGMAPAGNLGPTPAPMTSVLPPQEVLPEETLAPGSSPDVEDELSLETAEASMEFEIDTPEPKSPSPSIEVSFEDEEEMIVASSSPFPELSPEDLANESFEPVLGKSPEASPEESPEESPEQSFEESPSPAANVPVDDDEDFSPIQVNCGSFDERSAFREETDKWFNIDSLTAEDPYALSRFSSLSEGVLYATYRYAEENVTYSVPLPTSGLFELSLHWAEISPLFMQDGARVFEVIVNDKVVEPRLDVYRESLYGSYSPLVRSFLVDAPEKVITIQIVRKSGQPMLSAFEIRRAERSERYHSM